ncbi:MAG TPA: hypothetical protein VGJ84_00445 [Polyangiaceae bacterium]
MQLEKPLDTDLAVGVTRRVAKALSLRADVVRLGVRALCVGARGVLRRFPPLLSRVVCNARGELVTSREPDGVATVDCSNLARRFVGHLQLLLCRTSPVPRVARDAVAGGREDCMPLLPQVLYHPGEADETR